MNRRRFRTVLMAVLLLQVSAAAQAPTLDGEMQKLEFLVGEWKGEGLEDFPGWPRKNSFKQKTKVEITRNSLLRIRDERSYKPAPGMISHTGSGDAEISYDAKMKLYRWAGRGSKATLEAKLIADRTFQYGMPFSVALQPEEGYHRTTIRIDDAGEWHETIEEFIQGRWFVIEQSVLKRVK